MQALTSLRAQVRNQLLEMHAVVFVEGLRGNEKKMELAGGQVDSFYEKFESAIHETLKLTDSDESFENEELMIKKLAELRATYALLDSTIDKVIAAAQKGDMKSAKKWMAQAKNVYFEQGFLKQVSELITTQNAQHDIWNKNLKANLRLLQGKLIIFSIFAVLLALGFAAWVSQSISHRLKLLELATKKIGEGDLDISLAVEGKDEVAYLSRAFNKMAASLREAKEQVLHQQRVLINNSKMTALGEMSGGIAHEINNPLAVIQIQADLLMDSFRSDTLDLELAKEAVSVIEVTTQRIAKIVRSLSMFSGNHKNDPFEYTTVQAIVDSTLDLCRLKFEDSNTRLIVIMPPSFIEIRCRPSDISQVFLGIINNAYDAIQSLSDKWICVRVIEHENSVEVSVTDSGSGIPEEIVDKLMQPFFTTKEVGSGMGLGLSVSKGIVEAHGGKIYLDQKSPNTRFVIVLPKTKPNENAA